MSDFDSNPFADPDFSNPFQVKSKKHVYCCIFFSRFLRYSCHINQFSGRFDEINTFIIITQQIKHLLYINPASLLRFCVSMWWLRGFGLFKVVLSSWFWRFWCICVALSALIYSKSLVFSWHLTDFLLWLYSGDAQMMRALNRLGSVIFYWFNLVYLMAFVVS